ncbi:uncharacterized protein SPPG_03498 [Spizellomyces punctatus DAOM BR117]|uniref:Uncharacterized protein n=1 Tax=Spizellomyces punctatus (strain DAOM BR117) TaxID=645134 RepID=A0A0L0HKY5_SPIPD|nr:uncharacterized protein SPPG_03498 [Spizellomyces punctatus DAOM BR117]KND01703.1 hypothetical protein SPPG_03498 [Spizellomyces punctatus DAOM BR117]|eukprot:XP_016609742.1 hypothetical protein SPPG_03498 [Spizellomyces punctatus DAOM BR117]
MAAGMSFQPVWRPLVTDGLPSPRAGHTVSFNEATNECIVFGGASHETGFSNDVHVLDLATLTWRVGVKQNRTNFQSAPARYEHVAAIVRRNGGVPQLMVMYGAGEEGLRGDVWALDLETYRWSALKTRGNMPQARTLHSSGHIVLDSNSGKADRLYIFGGGLTIDTAVPDVKVYCLDVNSLLWIQVTTGREQPSPLPRLGHSLIAVGTTIYMFGGMDGDQTFDELWIFDTVNNTWSLPDTSGDRPTARAGHTATAVGTQLYIFGGFVKQPQPKVFDDVYVFNTETMVWSKLSVAALPPGPPCAVIDHDACMIHARPRHQDQGTEATESKDGVLIFGGMDLSGIYNYVFQLEL